MKIGRQVLLCALLLAVVFAVAPALITPVLPCFFTGHYAIAFGGPGPRMIAPEGVYPGFPPICRVVPGWPHQAL